MNLFKNIWSLIKTTVSWFFTTNNGRLALGFLWIALFNFLEYVYVFKYALECKTLGALYLVIYTFILGLIIIKDAYKEYKSFSYKRKRVIRKKSKRKNEIH